MKVKSLSLIAAIALLLGIAAQAKAAALHFSGTGTWAADAPATAYSAAGATWSFSFDLPGTISANPTTQFTNFDFRLNGISISDTLSTVQFYDANDGGLFGLSFASGGLINMFGDPVGGPFGELNGPAVAPPYALLPGLYQIFQINTLAGGDFALGDGRLEVTQTPLPAAWTLMLAGIAGYGALARRRRAKQQAAAA